MGSNEAMVTSRDLRVLWKEEGVRRPAFGRLLQSIWGILNKVLLCEESSNVRLFAYNATSFHTRLIVFAPSSLAFVHVHAQAVPVRFDGLSHFALSKT